MNGIETFRELKPNKVVRQLVTMISDRLSLFPSSKEFGAVLAKKKNENQHSTAFCLFMTNACKSAFYFNRENAQVGSSTVDIGIYKGEILMFVIEAKLLPTPSGTHQKPRYEYEYVYGKGAAIQRFKDSKIGSMGLIMQILLFQIVVLLLLLKRMTLIFGSRKLINGFLMLNGTHRNNYKR